MVAVTVEDGRYSEAMVSTPSQTALLLIDIQRDYFPGGTMELMGATEAGDQARVLLERFRSLGYPVVHVQHLATTPDATFFLPNTEGVEIHPLVYPSAAEEVIVKHRPNSFLGTALQQRLEELTVGRLVVAGMMTHMCVDASVRAAADLGYDCVVASDACATRELAHGGVTIPAAQVHGAFLAALGAAYAKVQPCSDVLRGLTAG